MYCFKKFTMTFGLSFSFFYFTSFLSPAIYVDPLTNCEMGSSKGGTRLNHLTALVWKSLVHKSYIPSC